MIDLIEILYRAILLLAFLYAIDYAIHDRLTLPHRDRSLRKIYQKTKATLETYFPLN